MARAVCHHHPHSHLLRAFSSHAHNVCIINPELLKPPMRHVLTTHAARGAAHALKVSGCLKGLIALEVDAIDAKPYSISKRLDKRFFERPQRVEPPLMTSE